MTKFKGATSGIMIDDVKGCFLSVLIVVIKLKEINGLLFTKKHSEVYW